MDEYLKKITNIIQQYNEGAITAKECAAAICNQSAEIYESLPDED